MLRFCPTATLCLLFLWASAARADAQACEVSPFVGYRFGGDPYELYVGRALDADAAASAGLVIDVFLDRGKSLSLLYSRQQVRVPTVSFGDGAVEHRTLSVEHWQIGGGYELDRGRVRPFLAGGAGVTRYGSPAEAEWRFSAGGGGGVKLMPTRHIGVRLDGRAYAIFADGGIRGGVCGGYACFLDVDVFVVWQVEFTAGLVVSF